MRASTAMKIYDKVNGYSLEAEKTGNGKFVRFMDSIQYAYSRFLKAAEL